MEKSVNFFPFGIDTWNQLGESSESDFLQSPPSPLRPFPGT